MFQDGHSENGPTKRQVDIMAARGRAHLKVVLSWRQSPHRDKLRAARAEREAARPRRPIRLGSDGVARPGIDSGIGELAPLALQSRGYRQVVALRDNGFGEHNGDTGAAGGRRYLRLRGSGGGRRRRRGG